MIIYFSATGNSKFVASQVAETTDDNIISITEITEKLHLQPGESLGIVIPTYFYWVPSNVQEFLENLEIDCDENSYIYCIATCGGTSGQTSQQVGRYLKKKGKYVNAYFDIVTPDNWTPMFDANNKDKIAKVIENEKPQLDKIISHIKNKESGKFVKHTLPYVVAKFISLFYETSRKTSHLRVEDQCIGCLHKCPTFAIQYGRNTKKHGQYVRQLN